MGKEGTVWKGKLKAGDADEREEEVRGEMIKGMVCEWMRGRG